jgi:hypothetical protein
LRINLLAAPTSGGMPRIKVEGQGLLLWNHYNDMWPVPDYATRWSENPVMMALTLMRDTVFGAGIPKAWVDTTEANSLATACDVLVGFDTVGSIGQEDSDTSVGAGDHDRLQSFVMPYSAVKIEVELETTEAVTYAWDEMFELRATKSGAKINAAARVGIDTAGAETANPYAFYGMDLQTTLATGAITAGETYYLVMLSTATKIKWKLNSLTNAYAGGHAEYLDGTWQDENYDHWFRVSFAEKKYRCSALVDGRQPWQSALEEILRTFHGRVGWWDGQYHLTSDWAGSSIGTLSDKEGADIPMLRGSFRVSRSEEEAPNVCIVTYVDSEDWTEKEVRYETAALAAGTEQARELRIRALSVPSGGQAYRLAKTWLTRARRTWRANCSIAQEGLDAALCDQATLDTALYAATRTVLINSITDGPDGRFDIELLEYAAADFGTDAHVPEAPVDTVGSLNLESVQFDDDFLSGGITDGTIGQLGWARSDWGPGVTDPAYSQETNHPGVLAIYGGYSGNNSSTTIELGATQAQFAKNSIWYARWIFRADNYDNNAKCTVKASDIHCRVFEGNLDISTNGGSSWTTLCTITSTDWVTFEASCDGAGTATYIVKIGTAVYTGTASISGSTVNQTISAVAYGETYATDAILFLDRATLALGADR